MATADRWRRSLSIAALLLVAQVAPLVSQAADTRATPVEDDALTLHARAGLASFTGWLRVNHVPGYIGEIGWPEEDGQETQLWNALAERWYQDADSANLWVTAWATGEWWGTGYPLAAYQDRSLRPGVDTPRSQARVIERHPSTHGRLRGVNLAGGEFGAPDIAPTSSYSNLRPGIYGRDYHYDRQETLSYLRSRGIRLLRIPFRWERIAPRLGRDLNRAEVQRLGATVDRARRAGLLVILDMHNYGGYYLSDGGAGIRRSLGSPRVPLARFFDVWRRISLQFRNNPTVLGYGLMNEPTEMASVGGMLPRAVWERASQAAVSAIRANRDQKWVMVSSYPWGDVWQFSKSHRRAWIRDPASRVRYEAHQYFDNDNSGTYQHNYTREQDLLQQLVGGLQAPHVEEAVHALAAERQGRFRLGRPRPARRLGPLGSTARAVGRHQHHHDHRQPTPPGPHSASFDSIRSDTPTVVRNW
jgi:hypothetical protein